MPVGFMCSTWGKESHNKGVTESSNNGVWKQEHAHACGKKRIYTAFLEAELEINTRPGQHKSLP